MTSEELVCPFNEQENQRRSSRPFKHTNEGRHSNESRVGPYTIHDSFVTDDNSKVHCSRKKNPSHRLYRLSTRKIRTVDGNCLFRVEVTHIIVTLSHNFTFKDVGLSN